MSLQIIYECVKIFTVFDEFRVFCEVLVFGILIMVRPAELGINLSYMRLNALLRSLYLGISKKISAGLYPPLRFTSGMEKCPMGVSPTIKSPL